MITIEPIEPSRSKPKPSPERRKNRVGSNNGFRKHALNDRTLDYDGASISDSISERMENSQPTGIQPGSQKSSWIQRAWCFLSNAFSDKPSPRE